MRNEGLFTRRQLNALAALGIKTKDAQGVMLARDSVLENAEAALMSIDDMERREYMKCELFGIYELRSMEIHGDMQIRAIDGEGMTVKGYPILFNSPTLLWGEWREQIAPAALDGVDMHDMKFLFNHNPDNLLGRVGVNVSYEVDGTGLYVKAEMPDIQLGRDIFYLIKRQILDGMSFMFRASKIETDWDNKLDTITQISELPEFSAVTFPAYPQTVIIAEEKQPEESQPVTDLGQDKEERDAEILKQKARVLELLYTD